MGNARGWVLVLVAVLVAGCGKQGPNEQFVARVDQLCRDWIFDYRAQESPPPALKQLRALIRANQNLPVERKWRADAAKRANLEASMENLRGEIYVRPLSSDEQVRPGPRRIRAEAEYNALYRRALKIHEAEYGLGLREPCPRVGQPEPLKPRGSPPQRD